MTKRQLTDKSIVAHVKRVVLWAKAVMVFEHIWPTLFSLIMLALTYAGISWLGIWSLMPVFGKIAGLILFAAALVFIVWRLFRNSFPKGDAAIARVEAVSGVSHRPLTSSLDELADKNVAPETAQSTLWQAHKRRIADSLLKLRGGWPKRQIEYLDPFGLRAVLVLLAFVGFNVAGPDRVNRLFDAFDFTGPKTVIVARLDAWVTPPRYTGRPPIFLTKETFNPEDGPIVVPSGSLVTIRTVNAENAIVTFQ